MQQTGLAVCFHVHIVEGKGTHGILWRDTMSSIMVDGVPAIATHDRETALTLIH